MTYLGIDGGGSKTAFLLVDDNGHEVPLIHSGPSNWLSVGQVAGAAAIKEGISQLPLQPDVVCGGFAGAGRPDSAAFYLATLKALLPKARIIVESDAFVSYVGAIGIQPGVLLMAGTGSIAIGRLADGSMIRVGGWGSQFGDEGSGFWIGREAVRSALRMLDSDQQSDFADRISRALGLNNIREVAGAWASGKIGVPAVADVFRELVRIYPAQPATRILIDAGSHLREMTEAAVKRVGDPNCRRAISGSVATHPTIRSLIGISFEDPLHSPERGAIIWAREQK
jgi:N-acetylglucosamine kinase-like BadF-type ATPase